MIRKLSLLTGLLLTVATSVMILLPAPVQAATAENCGRSGGLLGFPTWYKYLEPTFNSSTKECELNFEFPNDVGLVLAAVMEILLRVAMLVAIGFVVFGGVQFILSQGEPDRITTARSTLINALIGLMIAVVASSVVSFVAGRFTG